MAEQIYTIPVNDGFRNALTGEKYDCPFCLIFDMLEKNELELILGASMMEPDIRIETNKRGFCRHHYDMMYAAGNRLGLALMLESHLAHIEKEYLTGGGLLDGKGEKEGAKLKALENDCYVCHRIEDKIDKMFGTAIWLWEKEEEFRDKVKSQKFFCLPHYRKFIEYGRDMLSKKDFPEFYKTVSKIEKAYIAEMGGDISWFCKKFDYRYDAEPWKNSKDSVPRAINFIAGGKNS